MQGRSKFEPCWSLPDRLRERLGKENTENRSLDDIEQKLHAAEQKRKVTQDCSIRTCDPRQRMHSVNWYNCAACVQEHFEQPFEFRIGSLKDVHVMSIARSSPGIIGPRMRMSGS